MRRHRSTVAVSLIVLLSVATSSCTQLTQGVENNPKAVLGALGGAALGGGIAALAGGGTGAIVGATLGGALLGGAAGHYLDNRDSARHAGGTESLRELAVRPADGVEQPR
jgi:outer membrane lipoprotein SlyB